ncbi:MAG: hypothetical protein LAO09_04665 [Acidobacteriia bacterium]|nr:hypothetical protein [Terriglobia bacterium]
MEDADSPGLAASQGLTAYLLFECETRLALREVGQRGSTRPPTHPTRHPGKRLPEECVKAGETVPLIVPQQLLAESGFSC